MSNSRPSTPSLPRTRTSFGMPIQDRFGYCEAVRVGDGLHLAGQLARDLEGRPIATSDLYEETALVLDNILRVLAVHEVEASSLVTLNTFAVEPTEQEWQEVMRAHRDRLGDAVPTVSLVGLSALNHPDYRIEISAVAHVGGPGKKDEVESE